MTGKKVLVTTDKRGVFYGYLSPENDQGTTLTLTNARNIVYWSAETRGFLGLAMGGPGKGSKVGPCVPSIRLFGVTSIAECTDEAAARIEEGLWS